jgi:Fe-S oxidoreductase
MGPGAISLLMLAGFAGFGWLVWRKLQVLQALAAAPRFDHPLARLASVLGNGLLQRRMLAREWRPGLMHAVIFLGFLSLLLRKLQLIAAGYVEAAAFPAWFGGPFAAFKDFIELAVLAAVAYAFWRRFVLKPARLVARGEAVLVLSLIAAIMLTDFAFDAFRFARLSATQPAVAHEQAFAFIGGPLGHVAAGLSPAVQAAGYTLSYWVQMATVFGFLVLLPTGEHFHIVTALPALYFRRGGPANQVPVVDMDKLMAATDEAHMKAGIRDVRDLTWKEGFDTYTCTQCGRCKDACPTHQTGKPLSMAAVNHALRAHLQQQREALIDGKTELPPLVGPVIGEDTLWACTTCGYCEAACPIELEHLPRFFRLRQRRVMIDGEFPHELKRVFEAWESQGNAWGLPSQQRGDWAKGLGVPVVNSAADMAGLEYLFYVGSAMSYDPRGQKIARAFVTVMRAAGVRFGILGAREGSTGECARRLGNEMLFQQLSALLVETLKDVGATRIVTCDPHALNTLRNEYPAFGGSYEVLHHTTLIAQWLQQGRLKPRRELQRVVFHDPCYLGRHNCEYDAPRAVLSALSTEPPLEFALSREKAMCCGAGGGRMWLEETLGTRINTARAEQALAVQPQVVATACPYCAVMMADGLAAAQAGTPLPSRDIAELVAEAL